MRRNDMSNGKGSEPASTIKRSNWRQQVVRDQLGRSSQVRAPTPQPPRPVAVPLSRTASLKLNFVVVGGSIGGLAAAFALSKAGHFVHVVERRDGLVKDAAGIRIPPNLTRILARWGLWEDLSKEAIRCKRLNFRKLQSAEIVGCLEYKEEVMKVLGADFWLMHYCDILNAFYRLATAAGAVVQFNTSVVAVDPSRPSVTLDSGEILTPDIIIGADGYQSLCQQVIERDVVEQGGDPSDRKDSGTVVYSLNVDVSDITPENDPELYGIIREPLWTAYMGPHISVLTSPSRDYKQFSVQLFVPDVPGSQDSWDSVIPIKQMNTDKMPKALLKFISRAAETVETKFVVRRIEDWVHPDAKLVLLGESAHPQIPSSTHSGSLAVEDAAILGDLFSRLRTHEQIEPFLYGYQELRQERCWSIQQSEFANSSSVMLPDGPEQEERDRSMREAYSMGSGGWDETMFRHLWENIRILFAYDPEEEAEEWWQQWGLLRERAQVGREDVERAIARADSGEGFDEYEDDDEEELITRTTMALSLSPTISVTVESSHTHAF